MTCNADVVARVEVFGGGIKVELYDLSEVVIDGATQQLIEDVHTEVESFQGLGEFSPEVRDELMKSFLPDRISDTLNIEGVQVNARLTRAVLDGLAIAEADRYSEQEILNVNDANELIEQEARPNHKLTPALIRELHRCVENQLIPSAGAYRDQSVKITGAKYVPPHAGDVPTLVEAICEMLDGSLVSPIVASAWVHASLAKVHPFMDGNGRTCRMVQDFVLLRSKLLPVGIPINRRSEYYDALEAADDGNFSPLCFVIANAQLAALDKARRIVEAPDQRRKKIQRLVKAASQTARQNDYNRYEIWRRKMDGVVSEFTRWFDDLNTEADDFQLRHRGYPPLSFEKWKKIRDDGWCPGSFILIFDVVVRGKSLYKFLMYAKRHRLNWTLDPDDHLRDEVAVYLDGIDSPDKRFPLFRFDDPYISLREIVFDGGQVIVYREDANVDDSEIPEGVSTQLESVRWNPEKGVPMGDVIEQFIEQVLIKFGLIDT